MARAAPSMDLVEITRRHDLVDSLVKLAPAHYDLGRALKTCGDPARVLEQARRDRAHPRLLNSLHSLLSGINEVKCLLSEAIAKHAPEGGGPARFEAGLRTVPKLSAQLENIFEPQS